MKTKLLFVFASLNALTFAGLGAATEPSIPSIPNAFIDYPEHVKVAKRAEPLRETRRLTEADFLAKSREPGTVVLDARSQRMFERLHLEGAVNLTFPEFTEEALAKIIPTKDTRVLIYCNNNFRGSPTAMPTKAISQPLNISTYVALTGYGYTQIYELGPLLDVKTTALPLAGTEAASHAAKNERQRDVVSAKDNP